MTGIGKRLKSVTAIFLGLIIIISVISPTYASSAESELANTNEKIDELKKEQAKLKEALEGYGEDYDGIVASISNYEAQISAKEMEISQVTEQIAVIEADIDEQYELMKIRIKYTYENGRESYLSQILQAKSVSSLLTRIEYAGAIKEYDEKLIDNYTYLCETLKDKKSELKSDKEEIETLRSECEDKRVILANLIDETEEGIALSSEELEEKMAEAEALEKQIEKEKLEAAQKAAEEAARKAAEEAARKAAEEAAASEASNDATSDYVSEAGDEKLLAAIIYCEAGGESYEGQLAVGSVVMNRVNSSSFPNTVRGVIYQSGQFSPVASGKFELVLSNGTYSQSSLNAAKEVLNGNITVSFLYFHSASGWTSEAGTRIGNQVFY
ncbi:MAG: cell wall hydrolase [Eubacterium sp.]|nr:cell wall hydrolase [Eubacterium sp.]